MVSKLTKQEIEELRTPTELQRFIEERKTAVRADDSERPDAHLRKGYYKVFLDELVPLSVFCKAYYNDDVKIGLLCGNQAYDAVVRNEAGTELERIEIAAPKDGAKSAKQNRQVVHAGISDMDTHKPTEELDWLRSYIVETCRKKATKDYSDCLLVISVAYVPPFDNFKKMYEEKLQEVVNDITSINLNAKKIFLLILEEHRIIEISS